LPFWQGQKRGGGGNAQMPTKLSVAAGISE